MQFVLNFDLPDPLTLPIGHHSVIQGFLYHILSQNREYSSLLHDSGYAAINSEHDFKLFVFGPLCGQYKVTMPTITFYDCISLEVRSPMPDFCDIFYNSIMETQRYELSHQPLLFNSVTVSKRIINTSRARIRMLSPLTLSTTLYKNDKKFTRFIAPEDPDFNDYVLQNFQSKLQAATQSEIHEEIHLVPLKVSERDKYVTKFRQNTYITGWRGIYELSGSPQALSFLYDAGIGSRNAQGFGLFEVL